MDEFWLFAPFIALDVVGLIFFDRAVVLTALDSLKSIGFTDGSTCGLGTGETSVPEGILVTELGDTVLESAVTILAGAVEALAAKTLSSSSGGSLPEESSSSPGTFKNWVTAGGGLTVVISLRSGTAFFFTFSMSAAQRCGSIL